MFFVIVDQLLTNICGNDDASGDDASDDDASDDDDNQGRQRAPLLQFALVRLQM
ncbi:hypothetical protein [Mucilaginibacter sp. L196]|uniref:hypothetical protein n=1 Tax=Mucilaginibacter sp. L196 TaxID=1641870 RepID=UPI00131D7D0C|nr:hypothetical protein [Mucilaginibacter sp. L196]